MSKEPEVDFKFILERGRRRIFAFGDITFPLAAEVAHALDGFHGAPVDLVLSTEGGEVSAGDAIIDAMRTCRAPVRTLVLGACMSAGVLIAAAGQRGHRRCGPSAWFITHSSTVNYGRSESPAERIMGDAYHLEKSGREWAVRMRSLTLETTAFWEQRLRSGNFYFNAADAVRFGVVDKVVGAAWK